MTLPVAAPILVAALALTGCTARGAAGEGPSPTSSTAAQGSSNTADSALNGRSTTGPDLSSARESMARDSGDAGRLAPALAPIAQRPIPAGMQAVDALGVEIFAPKSLALDPVCESASVSRPASGLTYAIGCQPTALPVVWIDTAAGPATWIDPPSATCANSVRLGNEAGCLTAADPAPRTSPAAVTAIIIWPRHKVTVFAEFPAGQQKQALAVVRSAHEVSVDRHGCAATRSPVVPTDAASLPKGPVLPDDATSLGACWYSGGRLVASATLPGTAAKSLENPPPTGHAPGLGSVAAPYSPSTDGPSCGGLGRTEGIVFQTTRPDGSIAVAAAQFADCTGGQYWTDGIHARPVNEDLASAMYQLAGFLLVFGYRAILPQSSSGTRTITSAPPTPGR